MSDNDDDRIEDLAVIHAEALAGGDRTRRQARLGGTVRGTSSIGRRTVAAPRRGRVRSTASRRVTPRAPRRGLGSSTDPSSVADTIARISAARRTTRGYGAGG